MSAGEFVQFGITLSCYLRKGLSLWNRGCASCRNIVVFCNCLEVHYFSLPADCEGELRVICFLGRDFGLCSYSQSANIAFQSYVCFIESLNSSLPKYKRAALCRYISAISVVKDLVVLLDTGQVNGSTFTNTKTVIHELFGTFRPDDRINLVTFNSTSATLLQSTSVIPKSLTPLLSCLWR